MRKGNMLQVSLSAAALLLAASMASAAPFTSIRIGDQDGFGYGGAAGLQGSDGAAPNRNGTVILDQGDLLPDLNHDGFVAYSSADEFDNRLAEGVSCTGCANTGSSGQSYTDIALSAYYGLAQSTNKVYNANTGTFGAGGAFPDGTPGVLPNQPGFVFDFFVATGDINPAATLFFNLIFADYDVIPASVTFTHGALTFSQALTVQAATQDGLIQSAFATLNFGDVFSSVAGGYQGQLKVDFNAPNEPYTAFDFTELALVPIPATVPEPGTLALVGMGLLSLLLVRRRARA
jgi:hypothetical protein